MKKIPSLAFRKWTEDRQFGLGTNVHERLSTDNYFKSLKPQYDELEVKLQEWQVARAEAQDGGKILTLTKNEKRQEVLDLLVNLAKRVDLMADGSEAIILAAGYEVHKSPTRITELATPTIMSIKQGMIEGEVLASWLRVNGAINYAIEYKTSDTDNWKNGTYSSRVKQSLSGFEPGTKVQLRIRALGRNNLKSNWSDPVAGWAI